MPPADYVPMNLEQEVVMVADKYNSKSIPPKFLTAEAYARKAARFGESNRARMAAGCSNDTACLTSRHSPSSTTCVSRSRADRFQNT